MPIGLKCRRVTLGIISIPPRPISECFRRFINYWQSKGVNGTSRMYGKINYFGLNSHQGKRNMPSSQNFDAYNKLFSIKKLKFLTVFVVAISAFYHAILHLQNGHNTCKWLLTDGRYQGYNEWQPHGCMMHKYSKNDFKNCMNYISYWGGKNHFAFVGDSRIRQLYLEFVRSLSKAPIDNIQPFSNLSYIDTRVNVVVEFFWAPYVDSAMKDILTSWTNSDLCPRLIIIGSALWTIRLSNGSEDVISSFKSNISSLNSVFSKYKDTTEIVWMLQDHVVEARLIQNKSMITNRLIDLYNRATIQSLISSNSFIWSSSVLIGQGFFGSYDISGKVAVIDKHFSETTRSNKKDGFVQFSQSLKQEKLDIEEFDFEGQQIPQEAIKWDVQVLLNMICNNHMNFDDGSCCTMPDNPNTLQMVLAFIFASSLVLLIIMAACKKFICMSQKVSSLKIGNRIDLNRFSRIFPPNNNSLSDNNHEMRDVSGKEQIANSSVFGIALQAKQSAEQDVTEEAFTIFDTLLTEGDNSCVVLKWMTTSCEHRNSDDYIDQNGKSHESRKSTELNLCHYSSCHLQQPGEDSEMPDFYSFVYNISKLGIIISYFFVCDRTTFFMKENKYYTHVNFFLPFTYLMVLGLFFTENTPQTQVLNRNQTDEWKGWMQIVILIYHLTGASKVLSIYMQIRVMVSAYLFLSAYGHFNYFYDKNDFSLHRLCTVIFRFNFLAALLCLAMNRPYQFYNFIPLVTFWFVIIFFIMATPPKVSSSSDSPFLVYWCLLLKVVILIVFVTLLHSYEVIFDKVFLSYFLKPLFISNDESIIDWRFRWSVDRYSSIYGLVFTLVFLLAKKIHIIDDSKGNDLSSSKLVILASLFVSACGLVCYAIFASMCQNKDQCNETHSYIAFIPILCYIVLRNTLSCFRRKFSAFFAWFGKISLELFIAQYHIWLAADTHGVLVLVPSYPVLNLIITSFVFVCVAHELKKVTKFLTPLFIPSSKISLLRNITLIFLFIMLKHFLPF